MTTVVWEGRPVPWKRTLGSGKQRYTDPRYREWKEAFGWEAKADHEGTPWDWPTVCAIQVAPDGVVAQFVPLGIEVEFDLTPITERQKYVRADLDNYVKGVLDAVQGIVIVDDRLIVAIYASFTDTIMEEQ